MKTAVIVVDVQNDFTEGGSLPVTGGAAVAAGITEFLRANKDKFALVAASQDWHVPNSTDGGHFPPLHKAPDYQHTWPLHCLEGTHGAEFHPALDRSLLDVDVKKGIGVPAYSAFQGATDDGTALGDVLRSHEIDDLVVCGLATDYCVRQTTLDGLAQGFPVTLLLDLCAGVADQTTVLALRQMTTEGATVIGSKHYQG